MVTRWKDRKEKESLHNEIITVNRHNTSVYKSILENILNL